MPKDIFKDLKNATKKLKDNYIGVKNYNPVEYIEKQLSRD